MRPAYSGLQAHAAAVDNPIVLGRRFCTGCGRWRPVHDFPRIARREAGGLRARCWACHRTYQRRLVAARPPETVALHREYNRIWLEAKRRAAGIKPRSRRRKPRDPEPVFLEREPLVRALQQWPEDFAELERRSGIPVRSIHRVLHENGAAVSLDVADRLALALGSHLALIYGPDAQVWSRPPYLSPNSKEERCEA